MSQYLIRKNATGEVRTLTDLDPYDEFYFSEGGGSCDCMRRIWFADAGNELALFGDVCGYEEFSLEVRDGDKILYSEFDD